MLVWWFLVSIEFFRILTTAAAGTNSKYSKIGKLLLKFNFFSPFDEYFEYRSNVHGSESVMFSMLQFVVYFNIINKVSHHLCPSVDTTLNKSLCLEGSLLHQH